MLLQTTTGEFLQGPICKTWGVLQNHIDTADSPYQQPASLWADMPTKALISVSYVSLFGHSLPIRPISCSGFRARLAE